MPPEFHGKSPEINISEIPKVEGSGFLEIDNFLEEEKVKNNKKNIINVLNKSGNEYLKEWLKSFILTEKNIVKIWAFKLKLSQATDENSIEDIIRRFIPEWYKIWDKKVEKNPEKERTVENSWNLGDMFLQTEEKEVKAGEKELKAGEKELKDIKEKQENVEKSNKEIIREKLIQTCEYRERLLWSRPDVDEKTKKQRDEIKKNLPVETKKQLEEKGYDENFVNDYILLRVTLNEVKKDSSFDKAVVEQFGKQVNELSTLDIFLKKIDNACNIPDLNLDTFSKDNIRQTRTELFHEKVWNDSLRIARDVNIKSREYPEWFFDMENDEIIAQYGKFLPNEYKRLLEDYNRQIGQNHQEEYKQSEEYKTLLFVSTEIKEKMDKDAKKMLEELCIISQIKWMYMCMREWDNFDLNKSREIRIDEEWAMILDGHIDGIDFSIRQDINNPQTKLQTSQKLAKDGNAFVIGWKDKFQDSNFILPSQNEIFNFITGIVQSDSIQPLEDFDSPEDYLEYLQTTIMWNMEEKYEDTEYVHNYMKEQVKWEKIVNNVLWFLGKIDSNIIDGDSGKNITQGSNKDLYNFMKILKFNIDNSIDLGEINKFSRCINEIETIIDNYKSSGESNGIYSDGISKYLENNVWIDWTPEERLKLIFGLFNHFNENSSDNTRVAYEWNDGIQTKMIINDLYIQLHDKPKKKQEEQHEQQNKEEETNMAYENLMVAYDQTESMA